MYRIFSAGTAIECESPQDVAALLAVFAPPPDVRRQKAKPRTRSVRRAVKPRPTSAPAPESTDAVSRRADVLSAIRKSDVGLTVGELRRVTAKMKGPDRSNALQQLKAAGSIRRAGNAWVAA